MVAVEKTAAMMREEVLAGHRVPRRRIPFLSPYESLDISK